MNMRCVFQERKGGINSALLRLYVKNNPAKMAEGIVGVFQPQRTQRSQRTFFIEAVAGWAVERVVGAGDGDAVLHLVRQLAVDQAIGARAMRHSHREKHRGFEKSHQMSAPPVHGTIVADILH